MASRKYYSDSYPGHSSRDCSFKFNSNRVNPRLPTRTRTTPHKPSPRSDLGPQRNQSKWKETRNNILVTTRLATVRSGPRPEPFFQTVKKTRPYGLVNWDRSLDRKIRSRLGKNSPVSSSN